MDVTFRESRSYFCDSQASLQGEPKGQETPVMLPMMIEMSKEGTERVEGEETVEKERIEERASEKRVEIERVGERAKEAKENELLVYSRGTWNKRKTRETPDVTASPLPLPLSLSDEYPGNSSNSPSLEYDDLDVLIALRKGMRS